MRVRSTVFYTVQSSSDLWGSLWGLTYCCSHKKQNPLVSHTLSNVHSILIIYICFCRSRKPNTHWLKGNIVFYFKCIFSWGQDMKIINFLFGPKKWQFEAVSICSMCSILLQGWLFGAGRQVMWGWNRDLPFFVFLTFSCVYVYYILDI